MHQAYSLVRNFRLGLNPLEFQSQSLFTLWSLLCGSCRYCVAELRGHLASSIMGLTRRVCNCSGKSSLLIYTILTNCVRHGTFILYSGDGSLEWTRLELGSLFVGEIVRKPSLRSRIWRAFLYFKFDWASKGFVDSRS